MTSNASAVTVELAKKCGVLMEHAFPPRVPGNPAAGSAKGTGADQQKYYQNCLANDGNVGGDTNTPGTNTPGTNAPGTNTPGK